MKRWLGAVASPAAQPDLTIVGCSEHQALARQVAEKAITLVRDDARLLPLQGNRRPQSLVVVMPRPVDLTPADTSSYVRPGLAGALGHYHPRVDELIIDNPPTNGEIAALKEKLGSHEATEAGRRPLLILVTVSASLQPAQARLAQELLALDLPTITVAARTPYDLAVYPQARTHLCTYGIQPPSIQALAAALLGQIPLNGRLPVAISDLYARGHGLRL